MTAGPPGAPQRAASHIEPLYRHVFHQSGLNQPPAKEVHRARIVAYDVDHEHVPAAPYRLTHVFHLGLAM